MGFRFRKSIKILPGVRLNLGKKSASLSVGVPGATVNIGKRGVRSTVGIPDTGISYTSNLSSGKSAPYTPPSPPRDYSNEYKILGSFSGLASLAISFALGYGIFRIAHYHINDFLLIILSPFYFFSAFWIFYKLIGISEKYKALIALALLLPCLYLDYYASDYYKQFYAKKNEKIQASSNVKLDSSLPHQDKAVLSNSGCSPLKDGFELCGSNKGGFLKQHIGLCNYEFDRLMNIYGLGNYIWNSDIKNIKNPNLPNARYAIEYIEQKMFKSVPGTEKTLILDGNFNGIKVINGKLF